MTDKSKAKRTKTLKSIKIKIIRFPLDIADDCSKPLSELYKEKHEQKNQNRKTYSTTKLYFDDEMMILKKGMWFDHDEDVNLQYSHILSYSVFVGKPTKMLLLVTSKDSKFKQIILMKTDGYRHTMKLMDIFQNKLTSISIRTNEPLFSESHTLGQSTLSNAELKYSKTDALSKSICKEFCIANIYQSPNFHELSPYQFTSPDYADKNVVDKLPMHVTTCCENFEYVCIDKSTNTQENTTNMETQNNGTDYWSTKTVYGPCKYDHNHDDNLKWSPNVRHKSKTKSISSSLLRNGQSTKVRMDEDNVPWEVTISSIRHDPLVGNVVDENGSIYMYTAHQLSPIRKSGSQDSESSINEDDETVTSDSNEYDELNKLMAQCHDQNYSKTTPLKMSCSRLKGIRFTDNKK